MENLIGRLGIRAIAKQADAFNTWLQEVKRQVPRRDFEWYPYDSLGSFYELDKLLTGPRRFLLDLIGDAPVLDIGCGDGDVSFFLETLGLSVRALDNASTNYNRMRGVRALKAALRSSVKIDEVDLDSRFELPGGRYGAAFLFGVLYHLKNPIYALEQLARCARHCFLTTRIARFTPDRRLDFEQSPVAYLLGSTEANKDDTNYWIFSDAGLRRLLNRSGWEICDYIALGNIETSDPRTWSGDARAFCLARSRILCPVAPSPDKVESTGKLELLDGWHRLEDGRWRWTARTFSVAVNAAPVTLRLRLSVPESLLTRLGPMTLTARAGDAVLKTETFYEAGEYFYNVEIPSGAATVGFELDKALPPQGADKRELGLIVAAIEMIE